VSGRGQTEVTIVGFRISEGAVRIVRWQMHRMADMSFRSRGSRHRITVALAGVVLAPMIAGAALATAVSAQAQAAPVVRVHPMSAAPPSRATVSSTWWVPPLGSQPWQWELSNPLSLTNVKQMGTTDKLPNGSLAPAPVIYDIDGIINPASTITALHALGKRVVCYVEVGAVGNYYSTADEGVSTTYYAQFAAAGVLGAKVKGWPERYLDIRAPATVSIVESMIAQQCGAKGFDAVETDIDESYASANGFGLTRADEETYMTTLADYMHGLGLAWWIKNPDDTGDGYATDMAPLADAVLTEQCNQYSTCSSLAAYFGHKAIFNAEYHRRPAQFCANDLALGINGAQFNVNLTGVRKPCA
jgi:hypothetical protein